MSPHSDRHRSERAPGHRQLKRVADSEESARIRLNRFIARSGVCSRRKADELIASGRVEVNGQVVTELGTKVTSADQVRVNGTLITPTKHVHILLNKPRGVITTVRDDRGRETVLDLIGVDNKEDLGLFPVGRLDRDTTGVLLLTNDGELGNRLMHPRYEIEKLYVVQTERLLTEEDLQRLRDGVDLDGDRVRADRAAFREPGDTRIIGISIHEGRNRQIRRMIEAIGHRVERLERIQYAGLTVKGLRRGRWRHLSDYELKRLYRAVRLKTK